MHPRDRRRNIPLKRYFCQNLGFSQGMYRLLHKINLLTVRTGTGEIVSTFAPSNSSRSYWPYSSCSWQLYRAACLTVAPATRKPLQQARTSISRAMKMAAAFVRRSFRARLAPVPFCRKTASSSATSLSCLCSGWRLSSGRKLPLASCYRITIVFGGHRHAHKVRSCSFDGLNCLALSAGQDRLVMGFS